MAELHSDSGSAPEILEALGHWQSVWLRRERGREQAR